MATLGLGSFVLCLLLIVAVGLSCKQTANGRELTSDKFKVSQYGRLNAATLLAPSARKLTKREDSPAPTTNQQQQQPDIIAEAKTDTEPIPSTTQAPATVSSVNTEASEQLNSGSDTDKTNNSDPVDQQQQQQQVTNSADIQPTSGQPTSDANKSPESSGSNDQTTEANDSQAQGSEQVGAKPLEIGLQTEDVRQQQQNESQVQESGENKIIIEQNGERQAQQQATGQQQSDAANQQPVLASDKLEQQTQTEATSTIVEEAPADGNKLAPNSNQQQIVAAVPESQLPTGSLSTGSSSLQAIDSQAKSNQDDESSKIAQGNSGESSTVELEQQQQQQQQQQQSSDSNATSPNVAKDEARGVAPGDNDQNESTLAREQKLGPAEDNNNSTTTEIEKQVQENGAGPGLASGETNKPGESETTNENNNSIEEEKVGELQDQNEPGEQEQLESVAMLIDEQSCSFAMSRYNLSVEQLSSVASQILDSINKQTCNQIIFENLKLKSATNRAIGGQVMEVGSAPLDLEQFTRAIATTVYCANNVKENAPQQDNTLNSTNDETKPKRDANVQLITVAPEPIENSTNNDKVELMLRLSQQFDERQLITNWRLYPQLNLNNVPVHMSALSSSQRGRATTKLFNSDKCQRFKTESGSFSLKLLGLKTSTSVRVNLVNCTSATNKAKCANIDTIELIDFNVNELYLDKRIELYGPLGGHVAARILSDVETNNNIESESKYDNNGQQTGARVTIVSQIVQNLHDNNNYYRRNNWLLDLYGNWLLHEYKQQLTSLLARPLASLLNECLREVQWARFIL